MSDQAKVSWLFDSQALRIAPAGRPFWYTSGLIGPYYINTHFLCGGEQRAQAILAEIDERSADRARFPAWMLAAAKSVYAEHVIYREVIDALSALAAESFPLDEVSYVSGGERRDWFFAPLVAERLRKECLYIFNDLSIHDQSGRRLNRLTGAKILNVADLLTVASSYAKKWIPALDGMQGKLLWSLHVVDRKQGGEENLRGAGVRAAASLFSISIELFDEALRQGFIEPGQHAVIARYLEDPFTSMRDFLKTTPQFLQEALVADDPKTRTRARALIEGNLYKLD